MINQKINIVAGIILAMVCLATSAWAGKIRSTQHNLSISGTGDITASAEGEICIFCHIPHREGPQMPYIWNRSCPSVPCTPYDSSTLNADVGQPTGSSRMCLSCHDGTIALGATAATPEERFFKGGVRYMPTGAQSNIGTDLSDDHPISFVYDSTLSLKNLELKDPSMLHPDVKLAKNNQLQCTTCHDPHDDPFGRFLVMDNVASALCTTCHDKRGWTRSAHARSTERLHRANGLWSNTDYQTVAENGCENCHTPHKALSNERLLNFQNEEDNCMACHDGSIASVNIITAVSKPYGHRVQHYQNLHDAAEDFTFGNVQKHVACSDCHNAHQANEDASPGNSMVSGANKGVTGVSAGGMAIRESRYTYEICFKCHGDYPVTDTLSVTRQISQLNTREAFNPGNPSFHPVAVQGKNPNVPSLIPPYSESSTISCTDCHGNNDPSGIKGPHGSDYPHLLTNRYVNDDFTMESPSAYELCYKCHNRSVLLNDGSFPHTLHVVDQKTPCSACHDPHGISSMQGSALHNSHLINFDLAIVSSTREGRLEYRETGRFNGQCFLNCHGKIHNPIAYPE